MLMSHVNQADFIQIDNARTLEFLSTLAGVCSRHGILTEYAVENFRLELGSLQLNASSRSMPVLLKLIESENELISVMLALYGEQGLIANLLRHSLNAQSQELCDAAKSLIKTLCDKAKLKMNEEIAISRWQRFEGKSLLGSELLTGAEAAAKLLEELDFCLANLKSSIGIQLNMADDQFNLSAFNAEINQALGFSELDEDHIYHISADNRQVEAIAQALVRFFRKLQDWLHSLQINLPVTTYLNADLQIQELQTSAKIMMERSFHPSSGLTVLEINREKIIQLVYELSKGLRNLEQVFAEGIGANPQQGEAQALMSEQELRGLNLTLLSKGAKPGKAKEAVEALNRYLMIQGLQSHELLDAEIKNLHPLLNEYIDLIQPFLASKPAAQSLLEKKKQSLKRHDALLTRISSAMLSLILVIGLGFLQFSCGIKKPPSSRVETLRPSIPFRVYQSQPQLAPPSPETPADGVPSEQKALDDSGAVQDNKQVNPLEEPKQP